MIFAILGLPSKLVTDNEPQFKAEEFIEFCKHNGIYLVFSPQYHPKTNGSA